MTKLCAALLFVASAVCCQVAFGVLGSDDTNSFGQPKRNTDVWGLGGDGAAMRHGVGCMCLGCQEERNKDSLRQYEEESNSDNAAGKGTRAEAKQEEMEKRSVPRRDFRKGASGTEVTPKPRQPPNPLKYYTVNRKYPGDFGKFNKSGFCTSYKLYYNCSAGTAEAAANKFRRYWEYGQYSEDQPHPSQFFGERGFSKAFAGWSAKRDGYRLEDVSSRDLENRVQMGRIGYLLWKNDEQNRRKF